RALENTHSPRRTAVLRRHALHHEHAALQRQLPRLGTKMIGSRRAIVCGAFILCVGSLIVRSAFALGEKSHITSTPEAGSFALVESRTSATIFVDPAEWPG